jgi:toxin-antitoxin system PIN domain toxin
MFLLDVNVLIGLVDTAHEHHLRAVDWFMDHRGDGWATCPITENGFIRILSHPKYPNGPETTDACRALLAKLCLEPGHQFWPDSVSLRDNAPSIRLPVSRHLTDHYLLLLAASQRAQFASFDRRIDPSRIPRGADAFHVVGAL